MTEKTVGIKDVKIWLGEELSQLFDIYGREDKIIIKPKKFLGLETFNKAKDILRVHGGWYVSAGKDSCFQVLREVCKTTETSKDKELAEAIDLLERALTKLREMLP